MPIVKTETIGFEGVRFRKQVRLLHGDTFYITLPDVVTQTLGIEKDVQGKSLREAESRWDDAIRKYRETKTQCNKVILYKIERNCHIQNPDGDYVYGAQEVSFAEGISLSVWAGVFEEYVTTHANGKRTYRYERIESMIPASMTHGHDRVPHNEEARYKIEWSAERESFFVDLCLAMEDLILKINRITESNKTLMLFISSGQKCLPAPGDRSEKE